jgi:hypothetical protein
MDKKVCRQCQIEKSIKNFYKVPKSNDGYRASCKLCNNKITTKKPKTDLDDDTTDNFYKITRMTKDDYKLMYAMLKLMGYDINNGDIHQQFLDKWNKDRVRPMKYKKRRADSLNLYLPDGSLNVDNKKHMRNLEYSRNKKTPDNLSEAL